MFNLLLGARFPMLALLFKPEDGASAAVATPPREVTAADLAGLSWQGKPYADGVIAAALAEKHIVAYWDDVTVSDKASPTGKGASKAYVRLEALSARGLGILCNGKIEPATAKPVTSDDTRTPEQKVPGACDFFNYGFDLDRKAPVRQQIMASLEGPEKAVKKAVLGLVAAGYEGDTLRDMVKASPKFAGVDGIDKMIASALAA